MDIEKTMEFIIEQQARHATAIQQIDERLVQFDERMARVEGFIEANSGMIRQLVDVSMSLARHAEDTDRFIRELREAQAESVRELREAQAHSDRRLDALIDVVEKLTRRNGGAS
jgi:ABC-type transporter Mla subunit MlaD